MAFPLSEDEHDLIQRRIDGQLELIVAAAVLHDGAIIMVPRPGRHGNCINWLSHHGIGRGQNYECGFVTNRGRFVERLEAGRIVLANQQGSPGGTPENNPHMALYSEDMWNDLDEPKHVSGGYILTMTTNRETTPPTPNTGEWKIGDFAERIEDHFLVKAGTVLEVVGKSRGGYLTFPGFVGSGWNPNGWKKVDPVPPEWMGQGTDEDFFKLPPKPAAQDDPAKGLEVRAYEWSRDIGLGLAMNDCLTRQRPVDPDAFEVRPLTDHATAERQIAELRSRVAELVEDRDSWSRVARRCKSEASTLEALLSRAMKAWPEDHVMGAPLAVEIAQALAAKEAGE